MKQYNSTPGNDPGKITGIIILALLWAWLVYMLFTRGGFNGRNIIISLLSGIIIFVPLWKKYILPILNSKKK